MMERISNYDVLLEDKTNNRFTGSTAHANHIGNKRFEVFLNLHRESYNAAKAGGSLEEMNAIVQRIIDIVCNKCVPQGRFFRKNSQDKWVEMNDVCEVTSKIHEILLENTTSTAPSLPSASDNDLLKSLLDNEDNDETIADQDRKRRRRGSFARLRRISESIFSLPDDNQGEYESKKRAQVKVKEMDVLLVPNGIDTSSNNPGNARFRMLIDFQQEIFISADDEEKNEILDDLIKTVRNNWKSRFFLKSSTGINPVENDSNLRIMLTNMFNPLPKTTGKIIPGTIAFPNISSFVRPRSSAHQALAPMKGNSNMISSVRSLHSAAIQRLKKTKKKRQIMNRVRKAGMDSAVNSLKPRAKSDGQHAYQQQSTIGSNLLATIDYSVTQDKDDASD